MIVKVEVKGSRARIRTKEGAKITLAVTAPLLARLNGRTHAFFNAEIEYGGGKKDWGDGKGEVEYLNPTETIELGDALPDQGW